MKRRVLPAAIGLLLTGIALAPASGLAADAVLDRVRGCMVEPDASKRLECYDRELGRSASRAVDLGMNSALVRKKQAESGIAPPPPAATKIKGPVTAVRKDSYGRAVVTLGSGQVWAQQDMNLDFPVQVGDVVTLKPGLLGVLWMVDSHDRVQTRVKRLQ